MIGRSLWVVVGLMLAAASPVSLSGQAPVVDGDTFTLGSGRVRMWGWNIANSAAGPTRAGETEARRARRGVWTGAFERPSEWRAAEARGAGWTAARR